jgi:hypothetical protein
MTDRRPFVFFWPGKFCCRLDASGIFVRGGAQFLNLYGGRIGKIKVAHRLQFIKRGSAFAACGPQVIGNARKDSELDLSLGTACFAHGSPFGPELGRWFGAHRALPVFRVKITVRTGTLLVSVPRFNSGAKEHADIAVIQRGNRGRRVLMLVETRASG